MRRTDISACLSKAGIMALFVAEGCNSACARVLCRCTSRIIGLYDTYVRNRMKKTKNRKGRSASADDAAWETRECARRGIYGAPCVTKMTVVANEFCHRGQCAIRRVGHEIGARERVGPTLLVCRCNKVGAVHRIEIQCATPTECVFLRIFAERD